MRGNCLQEQCKARYSAVTRGRDIAWPAQLALSWGGHFSRLAFEKKMATLVGG